MKSSAYEGPCDPPAHKGGDVCKQSWKKDRGDAHAGAGAQVPERIASTPVRANGWSTRAVQAVPAQAAHAALKKVLHEQTDKK